MSDSEREAVATTLRAHFAVGRLDAQELEHRVSTAYAARTRRELAPLTADLPDLPPTIIEQRLAIRDRRTELRTRALRESSGGIGTIALVVVIWAATGGGYFWPLWVILALGIGAVKWGWDLYSPWGDLDRVEAELTKQERRDERPR